MFENERNLFVYAKAHLVDECRKVNIVLASFFFSLITIMISIKEKNQHYLFLTDEFLAVETTSLRHLCHLFESNQRFDLLLLADVQEMRMTTVCSFSTASIDCLYSHRCACRLTLSLSLFFSSGTARKKERKKGRVEKRKERCQ